MKPEFLFSAPILWGVGFPQNARHFRKTDPEKKIGAKNQNSGFIRFSAFLSASTSRKDFEKSFDDDPVKRV